MQIVSMSPMWHYLNISKLAALKMLTTYVERIKEIPKLNRKPQDYLIQIILNK